jgi:tetratricopeptide (TPR) repeat protein
MRERVPFVLLVLAAVAALVAASVWVSSPARAESVSELFKKAEKLADEEKYEESNELFKQVMEKQPDHPDVYWKIAMNYYDMGERIDIDANKAKKLEMYEKCEEWARKGYKKDPDLADNAFWMAVGISQQIQTKGIAQSLIADRSVAEKIEKYYLEAVKADEYHYKTDNANTISSAHYALGIFYRKMPSFPGVGFILGVSGDMDESVEHHQKALELFPDNVEYNKEMGVSYLCRGQKEDNAEDMRKGTEYLQKVLELPAENKLDKIDKKDAQRLLDDPSLACGYSRVQQEEVSAGDIK